MSEIVPADQALEWLMQGNQRYVQGSPLRVHQGLPQNPRVDGQSPFAVILGCSDSRVPSEIVFDQGVGDLFVIRTAGHRVDDIAIASVEFAVRKLNARLVMVLGHQNCGAITAAMAMPTAIEPSTAPGTIATNHIPRLLSKLQDVITRSKELPGDHVENAVRENVRTVIHVLSEHSSILQDALLLDGLKIVGAYYSLETGKIELID
jgi:carbonic anhydrase